MNLCQQYSQCARSLAKTEKMAHFVRIIKGKLSPGPGLDRASLAGCTGHHDMEN